MKKIILEEIELISTGIVIYIEFLIKAIKKGFIVKEVPIKFVHKTESGEMNVLRHGPKTFIGILKLWIEMKK